MARKYQYTVVSVLSLVSCVHCFLTDSPCHFDAIPVGSAVRGHSEVDMTTRAICRSGEIEWHYTFPFLLVTFKGSGAPYTICLKPRFSPDGYQFYWVKDGNEIATQTHGGGTESQDHRWCQTSDSSGDNMIVKIKPRSTYYMEIFDFTIQ